MMRCWRLILALNLLGASAMAPGFAQDRQERAKDDPDRLICRSSMVTGSRARRTERCLTRAQWDEVAAGGQRTSSELKDRLRGRPCGNPNSGC